MPVPTAVGPRLRALGFRYLHLIDAVGLLVAMHAISAVRFGTDWPTYPYAHYAAGFGIATILHLTVYYFGGLYEYEQRLGHRAWLPRASLLTLVAVLLSAAVGFATNRYLMPRANLILLAVVGSLVISFNRWLARKVRSRRFGAPRVLLVGSPDDIALAEAHIGDRGDGAEVAGRAARETDLIDAVDRAGATDVLLLGGEALDDLYPSPLDRFERRLIGVYRRVQPVDTLLGLQRSREIAGMPFVALRAHAVPVYRLRLKRAFDLAVLVLLSPVIVVVVGCAAVYVRLCAGSGIIYRQERVGHQGRPFVLRKFRTMVPDAEAVTGPTLAAADDPRILRGMRWFRAARLDELPQLWNVLLGQMSVVGPRPERPAFVEQFETVMPGYGRRHDIPPGITGLAQIRGHYQTDPGFKLGHDLQYIVNWSPVLDLLIMAETVVVMLRRSAR